MKGMWKIVLPVALMGLALSACEKKTEIEVPPAEPAAEAPVEPAAPDVDNSTTINNEAPAEAPADGMAPPADGAAPAETKEGAPTP
jgi:hypothetical protein